ncbi:MAG: hypothetical protein HPY65_08230 [Syntrophaceae bacterium]|nr:hypothetical protein [Syntrophaceae bacterium]
MKKSPSERTAFPAYMPASRTVPVPEGTFVVVFNPQVEKWVSRRLTKDAVREIRSELEPSLQIPLTKEGFARAADRRTDGMRDELHYDTVWIRDAMWVFFDLRERPERRPDARRLLLAVWDYYATPAQLRRFDEVIARPRLASDMMRVPHIRFDVHPHGPDDVLAADGRPQTWNHRQNDAHGLFLIALAEAVREGMVDPGDLGEGRWEVLLRFPAFFRRIRFSTFEDAGAWEELERRNTSSIGLVARAMEAWRGLLFSGEGERAPEPFRKRFRQLLDASSPPWNGEWRVEALNRLIARGVRTIRRQLALGGESPDYDPHDVRFRTADAALLMLLVPSPLEGLRESELRQAVAIVETLRGPAGILRYRNDSYQSGNYWIRSPAKKKELRRQGGTEESSSRDAFLRRGENLIPGTEAQWFFDSLLSLARLQLAAMSRDGKRRERDRFLAVVHLKRALGQLTGSFGGNPVLAANGEILEPLLPPESINTLMIGGRVHWLPSPITPLNWARAALSMALRRCEQEAFP